MICLPGIAVGTRVRASDEERNRGLINGKRIDSLDKVPRAAYTCLLTLRPLTSPGLLSAR